MGINAVLPKKNELQVYWAEVCDALCDEFFLSSYSQNMNQSKSTDYQ